MIEYCTCDLMQTPWLYPEVKISKYRQYKSALISNYGLSNSALSHLTVRQMKKLWEQLSTGYAVKILHKCLATRYKRNATIYFIRG